MPTAMETAIQPVVADIESRLPPVSVSRRSWYAIAASDTEAEVTIYEDIGLFGISAKQFVDDIEAVAAPVLHVRLNTYGGEVFDGIAMYNALQAHPAKVIVHVDGIAASAGSIVAMSGDEIRMADNAFLMIHEARGGVMGEAGDMRQYADVLDKINDVIAGTYQKRAGKTRKYWRDKMAEESWFTAEEAMGEGLSDTTDAPAAKATNRFDFHIYNQTKQTPEAVARAWGKTETKAPEPSPRGEATPVVHSQETSTMSTEASVAPAQAPAAGAVEAKPAKLTAESLREMTNAGFIEQGRVKGAEEARKQERDRLISLVAACPGKPQMAIDAYLTGLGPDSIKLAFEAETRAEARASEAEKEKDLEIQRLHALIATGGSPGVAMQLAGVDDTAPTREPNAQAEWEWENKPEVRKSARSKEIYVLARVAELDGTHRSFTRQPVSA
jgi:ATP-dependent protease ClpP protease subunit